MPNQSTTPLGFMDTYAVQVINDTGDEKIACWDIVGKLADASLCVMGAHHSVSFVALQVRALGIGLPAIRWP